MVLINKTQISILILILMLSSLAYAGTHSASSILPGTFIGNYSFDGNTTFNGTFKIKSSGNGTVFSQNWSISNATGGTITTILVNGINYSVHTFTSDGVFTPNFAGTVEYLVVAGGGGGGQGRGAGGGAGGYIVGSYTVSSGSPITVNIGFGGIGGNASWAHATNGNNSIFGSITATGGGGGGGSVGIGGGNFSTYSGYSGGSGGGSGSNYYSYNPVVGNASPIGQGNNGGAGYSGGEPYNGGGGGGAGATGSTGIDANGGVGLSSNISGSVTYYAGGAGAGSYTGGGGGPGGNGGNGGGGHGGPQNIVGTAGTSNTGGGGGNNAVGGAGGSGIVIVRYAITNNTIYSNLTDNINSTFTINSIGSVGIGNENPLYKLDVNGTIYATGAAGSLSDIRHKKNINNLSFNALNIIRNLNPVSYEWINPIDNGMLGEQLGFIAQDVEKVLPNVILTQDDEEQTKAIKYNELIPILTKAIQEQQKQIEMQQTQINLLQNELCEKDNSYSFC